MQNERLRLEHNKVLINDSILGQLSQRTNELHLAGGGAPTGPNKKVSFHSLIVCL